MKLIATLLLSFIHLIAISQNASQLVTEGVALHDNGKYEEAIKKYDAAIAIDNNHYLAHYERSYSLLAAKKYQESVNESEFILKQFKKGQDNASVYINYGTGLDLLGKQKDAVKVYEEGIKKFPTMALLHYNKAITLNSMQQAEEALEAVKASILLNPYHASSQNFLSAVSAKSQKIQSLLASLVLIAIEPKSQRAKEHVRMVESALSSAKKTGDNSVTINLEMLGGNNKKNDDLSAIEMFLGLNAALDFDDKHKNETKVERMIRKLEGLGGILGEMKGKKKTDNLVWSHYAPFFSKLKSENQLETFSHIIYLSSNDEENKKWLQDNQAKIESFNSWFKGFWKKG